MTIKTECVVKHLKHDYANIAIGIGIAAGAIASLFIGWVAATNAYLVFNPLAALIAPHWTALNVLNVLLGIIALRYTIGIAVFGDKNSFVEVHEETSMYDHSKTQKRVEYTNLDILGEPIILGGVLLLVYSLPILISWISWDEPILTAIVYTIVVVVGTPIGCAIARCKE